jgi:hypothetical protein
MNEQELLKDKAACRRKMPPAFFREEHCLCRCAMLDARLLDRRKRGEKVNREQDARKLTATSSRDVGRGRGSSDSRLIIEFSTLC